MFGPVIGERTNTPSCPCCWRPKKRDGVLTCAPCAEAGCKHHYGVWKRQPACPGVARVRRGQLPVRKFAPGAR